MKKALLYSLILLLMSTSIQAVAQMPIFPKGERGPADHFTGTVWVHRMIDVQDSLDIISAVVTFEPGARTNWHIHPGGQALLVIDGKGRYQEKGKSVRIIQKGDVVKCSPGVEHWHGASPDTHLTHIAIATNAEKGNAEWLKRVTDLEYHSEK